MLCWLPWKNLASRILKQTLIKFQKPRWTLKIKALNFTKALIGKYMDYFADKSKIFNYGTDEYANDATNAQGWYYLKWYGLYNKFIDYSNSLAAMAKERGLQPMAFNDGFYYEDKDDVQFDKDVLISYWSKGWWGYNLASPQYLASKGYKFLNTNGDWYYILGQNQKMVVVSSKSY